MKNKGIQGKLVRAFCLLIISALLITNIITSIYLFGIHREETINNYRIIGENSAAQIEKHMSTIENFARLVCFDTNLQNLMRTLQQKEGYAYHRTTREITSTLSQYATIRDDLISDIYIVDTAGTIISRNGFYANTLDSKWYKDFRQAKANLYFSAVYEAERRATNSPNNHEKVISCIVSMFDSKAPTHPNSLMGHVIINIKYDALTGMMKSFNDMRYMIFTQDGKAIDETNETAIGQKQWIINADTPMLHEGDDFYFQFPLPPAKWILVTSVEVSTITVQILRVAAVFTCVMLVIMGISGRIVFVLARNITDPLKALATGIQQFSTGDFNTRVEIKSGDEVERISLVFNDMVDKIKDQMQENLRKEAEKRKSEIRFLMAQIKPHFIYNSLNCIIYMARDNKNQEIIHFTRAFISLLQVAIKTRPQELVSIYTEIEYLNNYVTLLGYRYDRIPKFTWDIECGGYDLYLPGLILMPIIENSIFHGFIPQKISGHIHLSVTKEGERVKILLQDDGCGIPPDTLEKIRENLCHGRTTSEKEDHIGLYNVNERLKLCLVANGGLQIDSTAGLGTKIWFYLNESCNGLMLPQVDENAGG